MDHPDSFIVNERDARRIRELHASALHERRHLPVLHELVERIALEADIVRGESIPPTVVTMHSCVEFAEPAGGPVHRVTLVYPEEVSLAERRISVLSPVGRALLGRSAGDLVRVETPDGAWREVRIVAIPYQPEAAGLDRH